MITDIILPALTKRAAETNKATGLSSYEREALLAMQDDVISNPATMASFAKAQGMGAKRLVLENALEFHCSVFGSFNNAYAHSVKKWSACAAQAGANDYLSLKKRATAVAAAAEMVKSDMLDGHCDHGSSPTPERILSEAANSDVSKLIVDLARRHEEIVAKASNGAAPCPLLSSLWDTSSDKWVAAATNAETATHAKAIGYDGGYSKLRKTMRM